MAPRSTRCGLALVISASDPPRRRSSRWRRAAGGVARPHPRTDAPGAGQQGQAPAVAATHLRPSRLFSSTATCSRCCCAWPLHPPPAFPAGGQHAGVLPVLLLPVLLFKMTSMLFLRFPFKCSLRMIYVCGSIFGLASVPWS